jgi:hypothetical protein
MTRTLIQQAEQCGAEPDSMHSIANGLYANQFIGQRVTKSEPCLFLADLPTLPEPKAPPTP